MIKVTYHESGVASISVLYGSNDRRAEYQSHVKGWVSTYRNGTHICWNEHDTSDRVMSTTVAIFDVDTVYKPSLDRVYFCRTPEAECALAIAREAFKHD